MESWEITWTDQVAQAVWRLPWGILKLHRNNGGEIAACGRHKINAVGSGALSSRGRKTYLGPRTLQRYNCGSQYHRTVGNFAQCSG